MQVVGRQLDAVLREAVDELTQDDGLREVSVETTEEHGQALDAADPAGEALGADGVDDGGAVDQLVAGVHRVWNSRGLGDGQNLLLSALSTYFASGFSYVYSSHV